METRPGAPSERLITYILKYTRCDSPDQAGAILEEARAGNPVAEYITGMALAHAGENADERIIKLGRKGLAPR